MTSSRDTVLVTIMVSFVVFCIYLELLRPLILHLGSLKYILSDILKEMSYNPKMGEQFGFVTSTSTRFRYDRSGDFV